MLKKLLGTLFVGAMLTLSAGAHEAGQIVVTGVWARATQTAAEAMNIAGAVGAAAEATAEASGMGGMNHGAMSGEMGGVSAVYAKITNAGDHPMTLIGAEFGGAQMVQIHEVVMDGDVMKMQELTAGLPIGVGETVELRPGGYHIMLMGLQTPLVEGSAINVHLIFGMGEGMDDQHVIVGAPLLFEAPSESALIISDVWARPSVSESEALEMGMGMGTGMKHGGMDNMGGMHGGMGEATAEPMHGGMGGMHGNMGGMNAGGVSAAYMTITNTSQQAVTVVSASAEVSYVGMTQIHEMKMQGDVMQMQELAEGLTIGAGETVELRPGGYHIMLMDLQMPLAPGYALAITLTLDNGETVVVGAPIYDKLAME